MKKLSIYLIIAFLFLLPAVRCLAAADEPISLRQSQKDPALFDKWTQNDPALFDNWTQNDPALVDNRSQTDPALVDNRSQTDPALVDKWSQRDPALFDNRSQKDPAWVDNRSQTDPAFNPRIIRPIRRRQKDPALLDKLFAKFANRSCPPGTVRCGNFCQDLANDPLNCGDCGFVCPSGACNSGICTSPGNGCIYDYPPGGCTYDLARLLTGSGYSDNNYDFGTFTVLDNGDALRVAVLLNPDSIYVFEETYVEVVALNYVEGSEFSTYTYTVNIIPSSVLNDEDNVKMGEYKNKFDLRAPDKGNIHPAFTRNNRFTFVISAVDADGNPVDLKPEDLLNPVGGDDVMMALYLGGLETNIDGSDSAYIPFIDDDQCASPI